LQDTMYSRTSGFDDDGRMMFARASEWVESLEFGGLTDWRLPMQLGEPLSGRSEIFVMFESQGWTWDPDNGYDLGSRDWSPFLNFEGPDILSFWLQPRTPGLGPRAWNENLGHYLPTFGEASESVAVWAVRDGRALTRVPEPSSLWLVSCGVVLWRCRHPRRQRVAGDLPGDFRTS
jgi:hypothetical protein